MCSARGSAESPRGPPQHVLQLPTKTPKKTMNEIVYATNRQRMHQCAQRLLNISIWTSVVLSSYL